MRKILKEDWPELRPYRTTPRGSNFKIGTNDLLVDVPNFMLNGILNEIYRIEEESKNPQQAYNKIMEEIDGWNKTIEDWLAIWNDSKNKWLKVRVYDMSASNKPYNISKKPYNIRLDINWNELLQFLDFVAHDDNLPLAKKYTYISQCRQVRLPPKEGGNWLSEKEFKKIQNFAEEEIKRCKEEISDIQRNLEEITEKCRRKKFFSLFYMYSKDLTSSLKLIEELLDEGRITTCYRELRNLIEEMSVALFHDRLNLETEREHPNLPIAIREWYNEANNRSEKKELILNSLKDLKNCFSNTVESIHEHFEVSKNKTWDLIVKNLDVPLFIAGACTDKKLSGFSYPTEEIKEKATDSMERIFLDIKDKNTLLEKEKEMAGELVDNLLPASDEICLKFPTGFLARQYVGKVFGTDFNKPYNRYSYFSHSYLSSWQITPGSSILEYKAFGKEIHEIYQKFKILIKEYDNLI